MAEKTGAMKPHYFDQDTADMDDFALLVAIAQGYVPDTCLLNGNMVMSLVFGSKDPCKDCNGPREKCKGRPKHG